VTNSVREFFDALTPISGEDVSWLRGAMKLRLAAYLTTELPPLDYITSARAVVVADGRCAVLRNVDGTHILPGGRRHPEESLHETLCRELLEETGCSITSSQPVGLLHFHHLTAQPADYPYPYPDFVHAVSAVRGVPNDAFTGDPDRYETSIEFLTPAELDNVQLPAYQRLLLAAALRILD
jgi:8-oxo-dGTP pyrophosphatase MutT (NUDIX family)